MNKIELVIPKLGESVEEVTLTKWLRNEGDWVNSDDTIAEVSTDKVDSEVPSPYSGKLIQRFFKEGDTIKIGEVFAVLELAEETSPSVSTSTSTEAITTKEEIVSKSVNTLETKSYLSPLVKKIALEENVSSEEIAQIKGSGHQGRISKNDMLHFLSQRHSTNSKPEVVVSANTSSMSGGAEIIEMDKMRRLILQHMKKSKQTSPHVTAFVEADVTNMVKWREANKELFLQKYNQKLTVTPLIVDACVRAIKDFPMINVSVDETETKIIKHPSINIGIATALPNGNLIVPVIKKSGELNLEGLAKGVNQLVQKARTNKLAPDDVAGGTFTISNVGTFGNIMGTPIINQPEVAILATGVIKKKPAVLETPDGDVVAVRQFMFLSLSFDHRVVDGSLGGVFLSRIAEYMEKWDMNTQI